MKNIFITATDTGVGKTLVSTLVTLGLQKKGYNYSHFKPVQSGLIEFEGKTYPPDLFFSAFYTGKGNSLESYCEKYGLYSLKEPLSPDFAAERDGIIIDKDKIILKFKHLSEHSNLIVEGAGGAAVPLTNKYFMADMIADLKIPAIIVTRPKLGTLNHTFLTANYLRSKGVEIAGIVISGYPQHPGITEKRNIAQLESMNNLPIIGIVPEIKINTEEMPFPSFEELDLLSEKSFKWDLLTKILEG